MEDLLYRISRYETKGYWLDRFKEIKENYGIDAELVQVGEETYVDIENLFGIIDELYCELERKQEELEDTINRYEDRWEEPSDPLSSYEVFGE